MAKYKHLVDLNNSMVKRLTQYSGLKEDFVQNIIRFSKCMAKPDSGSIDSQIYSVVLSTYFNIIDQTTAMKVYNRMAKKNADGCLSVEDFCGILCVFFSDSQDIKIDYVYALYDINSDGAIDQAEVSNFVKACKCVSDVDEADKDETFMDLCTMASDSLGIGVSTDGVTLEMFREKVKQNSLIYSILGQSLPPAENIQRFRHKIEGKSNLQMKETFGKMRRDLLFEIPDNSVNNYYPIVLDLP